VLKLAAIADCGPNQPKLPTISTNATIMPTNRLISKIPPIFSESNFI
jgi:hypothetical protein